MLRQPIIHNQDLIIQRFNQGVKLIQPNKAEPFKKHIPLSDMLSMPFHVCFMNQQSALEVFNESILKTYNILSESDAIGITARDVAIRETADICIHHDNIVINTNQAIIKDELHTRLDGYNIPTLAYKFPWYNDDHQVIGVFGLSILLDQKYGVSLAASMNFLAQTGLLQTPEKSLPGLVMDNMYFTEREKFIMFQLLCGKSARAIADKLSRSKRTVEGHIENIKIKTNSSSKAELIEKMMNLLL
jgi:DNA-binding CsgD family transcriptional regulator